MTTQLFINYNPISGATIASHRSIGRYHDNDFAGFLHDAVRENIATCSVDLHEAQYALMDGEFLALIDAVDGDLQALVEEPHSEITKYLDTAERVKELMA